MADTQPTAPAWKASYDAWVAEEAARARPKQERAAHFAPAKGPTASAPAPAPKVDPSIVEPKPKPEPIPAVSPATIQATDIPVAEIRPKPAEGQYVHPAMQGYTPTPAPPATAPTPVEPSLIDQAITTLSGFFEDEPAPPPLSPADRGLAIQAGLQAAPGVGEHYRLDPATGLPVYRQGSLPAAQQQFNLAPQFRDTAAQQREAVEERHRYGGAISPRSEYEAIYAPGPLESPFTVLEPFDWPRRFAWKIAEAGGSILPDPTEPGEEPTFTSRAGDYLEHYTGKIATGILEHALSSEPSNPLITLGHIGKSVWDEDRQTADEVGERLYKALSTGKLSEQASARRGYDWGVPFLDLKRDATGELHAEIWPFSEETSLSDVIVPRTPVRGFSTPNPMGIDLIDSAVPPQLAEKLYAEATTKQAKLLYGALTTHFGREGIGLAMEFAADPLWAFGPAKGASTVYLGDKAVNLAAPMTRAAMRAATVSGVPVSVAKRHAARLVMGSPEEKEAALTFFEEAITFARKQASTAAGRADEAAQGLSDPAKATQLAERASKQARTELDDLITYYKQIPDAADKVKLATAHSARLDREVADLAKNPAAYLKRTQKANASAARNYQAATTQMQRAVTLADRGTKVVQEGGTLAYHLPFSEQTHWVSKLGGETTERAANLITSPVARVTDKVGDWLVPYSVAEIGGIEAKNAARGKQAAFEMTPGQQWAYAYYQTTAGLSNLSKAGVSVMARMFGSRFIQPLVSRVLIDAQAGAIGVGAKPFTHRVALGGKELLQRVPQELWTSYHESVSGFFDRTKSLEQQLIVKLNAGINNAQRVAGVRKVTAASELAQTEKAIAEIEQRARTTPYHNPDRRMAEMHVSRLKAYREQVKGWMDPLYSAQSVLDEAMDLIESGAGALKDHTGIQKTVEALEHLRFWFPEQTFQERDRVTQAMVAMSRWAKGDPGAARELIGELKWLQEVGRTKIDETTNRLVEELVRAGDARMMEIDGLEELVKRIQPERLAEALEAVQRQLGHAPYKQGSEATIDALLERVFLGNRADVDDALTYAAVAMGVSDRHLAIRMLADLVSLQSSGKQVVGFTTAVGSTYTVRGTSTQRTKAPHQYHDPKDVGLKEKSDLTVYVSPELGREIGMWNSLESGRKQIRLEGETLFLLSEATPGKLGRDKIIASPIFSREPAIGMQPLELWLPNDMGHYRGNHPGSAITSLTYGGGPVAPGRTLLKAVRELMDDWESEAKAMRRLAAGKFTPENEARILADLAHSRLERMLANLKAQIGGADWDAFLRWVKDPARTLPKPRKGMAGALPTSPVVGAALVGVAQPENAAWRLASEQWDRMRALADAEADLREGHFSAVQGALSGMGVEGGRLGPFTKEGIASERIRRAMEGASSEADVRERVRAALFEIVPFQGKTAPRIGGFPDVINVMPGEARSTMLDDLADRIAKRWAQKEDPLAIAAAAKAEADVILRKLRGETKGVVKEAKKAIVETGRGAKRTVAQREAELQAKLKEVQPRFEIPSATKVDEDGLPVIESRVMQEWEIDLFAQWRQITKGLAPHDAMLASFAALRHGPDNPEWMTKYYKELEDAYGQVVGRRFQDLPDSMEPVVYHLRSIIASYEKLYETHGMQFMKNPLRRLQDWGVVDYVPHIATEGMKLTRGAAKDVRRALAEGDELPSFVSTVDQRLTPEMDAARKRNVRGTVAEINARTMNSDLQFSFEPELILGRYVQSTRAIAAKEFLEGLRAGGVTRAFQDELVTDEAGQIVRGKPAAILAAEADYVPLFQVKEGKEFARWLDDIPEIARGKAIETMLLRLPEGYDPTKVYLEAVQAMGAKFDGSDRAQLQAWTSVALDMNKQVKGDKAPRTTGEYLKGYYASEAPATQLYVPAAVYQSMKDLFDLESHPIFKTAGARAYRDFQNFWKKRITVVSVAFTTRNAVSNQLSNIQDLGIFGASSPRTQLMAAQLSSAAMYADAFGGGSLRRAWETLQTKTPDPRLIKGGISEAQRLSARVTFQGQALDNLVRDGIDFGDGILRDADEAMTILRDRSVVSQSYTQFVDIAHWEQATMEAMLGGGWKSFFKTAASMAEDALITSFPFFMANRVIAPIGLPKAIGEGLARFTENQGRLVNFIGNMRKNGSVEEAAAHVQKFLFDYGDLNQFQRTLMRMLVPFWAWTSKNVGLQLEMMRRSPVYYAKFRQLLVSGGPRVVGAGTTPATEPYQPVEQGDPRVLGARQPYSLSKIRVPIPEWAGGSKNQYIEGFGTPFEAFVEQLGTLSAGLNPYRNLSNAATYADRKPFLRILGQGSFAARFAAEFVASYSAFYGKPLSELTNAGFVHELIAGASRVPIVGPDLAEDLLELTGFHMEDVYQKGIGTYEPTPTARPRSVYAMNNMPLSRVFRDAAALTDTKNLQMGANLMLERELHEEVELEIPLFWRVLDAYFGIRVVQDSQIRGEKMLERSIRESEMEEMRSRGGIGEKESYYMR